MEKEFIVNTEDNFLLYGYSNINNITQTNKAVIFVHGLTGNMYEHIHYNGSKTLSKDGYTTFRFNFHSSKPNSRSFIESTISNYISDLNSIIKYVTSQNFEKIYIISHSLGCIVSLFADLQNITSLVLLDPTDTPSERYKFWGRFYPEFNSYILDFGDIKLGYSYLCGKEFIDQAIKFPNSFEKIGSIKIPIKIITAGSHTLLQVSEKYYNSITSLKKHFIVKGATHCFDEEGTEEIVFEQISAWLNNFV